MEIFCSRFMKGIKNDVINNIFSILENSKEWKIKEPEEWNPIDYSSYLWNTGIANFYFKFFNCIERFNENINENDMSIGFRPVSLDISRAWAQEKKWIYHKCRFCKNIKEKHSKLDENKVTATWQCPIRSDAITQIPMRYTYPGSYVPITFDIENKDDGMVEILKWGYKSRIWHFELSIFDNRFREEKIYPDGMKEMTMDDKWERVNGHNLMMEFDCTKERVNGKGIRRNFFEDGDKIIENAQRIIDIINSEINSKGILDYEWWFSGNGIYFIMNYKLNDVSKMGDNDSSRAEYFKKIIRKWAKYQLVIIKLLKENKVNYINLDYKEQFIRSYVKAPYSLHRKYDRIVLPLTSFFGSNDKVNLLESEWRKYTNARNIDKDFIYINGIKGVNI